MKNLKFSIEEIEMKPFFNFFTIVQLSISFIFIFIIIAYSNFININQKEFNNMFNKDPLYIFDTNSSKPLMETDYSNINEFYNFIENKKIELYSLYSDSVCIDLSNIPKEILNNQPGILIKNKEFDCVNCIRLNKNYLEKFGVKLSSGNYKNIDKSYIPVILGDNYKKIVKLDELIPYAYTNSKGEKEIKYFKVCGFADKNDKFYLQGDLTNVIDANNNIIIIGDSSTNINEAEEDMVKKINLYNYYTNGYLELENKNQIEEIQKLSTKLGLNYGVKNIKDVSKDVLEQINHIINPLKIFAIILLIFTIISIIIVMTNLILNNINKYAINMLVGASESDIISRIFIQIAILSICAFVFALLVIIIFISDKKIIQFNINNIIEFISIVVFTTIVVSIIPIRKFRHNVLSYTIKGSE